MPPPRLPQRAFNLLRELNLLVCGADAEELKEILAALVESQAFITARLREERRRAQDPEGGSDR